ncbi:MAG: quinate 5-dehydrogenase, partial [Armatimonadetes bacterium]|nr:quinate 5-dehydrogenase [Armatimonadota bacterium]
LDGEVDAFGLGGTDLYIWAGRRRYVIRDAARIAAAARRTPLLDGSGLKNTLEREAIRRIEASGRVVFAGRRALLVSAVDRWGMAEALWERCREVTFGDLMFALGLPIPLRSLSLVETLARLLLPLIVRLPFTLLYPTGEAQTAITPRHGTYYAAADIIAGDFHLIRRFLPAPADPPPLAGKVIITNTTTPDDLELLRERGAATLVTTTPQFEGRSFGTNVLEACFTALAGSPAPLPPARLMAMLDELGWEPTVVDLSPAPETVTP